MSANVALVCIFSPKIYIVLFEKDKNVRKQVGEPMLSSTKRSTLCTHDEGTATQYTSLLTDTKNRRRVSSPRATSSFSSHAAGDTFLWNNHISVTIIRLGTYFRKSPGNLGKKGWVSFISHKEQFISSLFTQIHRAFSKVLYVPSLRSFYRDIFIHFMEIRVYYEQYFHIWNVKICWITIEFCIPIR
jgi:hypothetical protein